MGKFINALKKLFNKTFFIIIVALFFASTFFYWGWYVKQYHKAIGVYFVYKGDKAYQHSDLQKAIDYYNKGLQYYPEHYSAQYNLGNIYVVYEDYFSAADAYQKAIEYNPQFTLARMNLGIISSEKLGDFDEAIRQYQAIIDSNKRLWFIPFVFNNKKSAKENRGLAYYNMGVAYRKKALFSGDDDQLNTIFLSKAINSYKNAVKILKNDYDSRYNLALAYHLSGDYKNAGLNYCKSIELRPMDYEAHYNLAILLKHLKMYKEAYKEIEKATILVTNNDTNTNITTYVFSILNDMSKTLIENNQYKYLVENIDNQPSDNDVTYINGKIVATDSLDRAILKNFKTCETEQYFENY